MKTATGNPSPSISASSILYKETKYGSLSLINTTTPTPNTEKDFTRSGQNFSTEINKKWKNRTFNYIYKYKLLKDNMKKEFVKHLKEVPIHKAPKGITYQKIALGSSIEPVEFDYVPIKKTKSIAGHIHKNSNALVFILKGSGSVVLGKKKFLIKKDDIINIPAGTWHEFHASKKENLIFLSVQHPPIKNDYIFKKN